MGVRGCLLVGDFPTSYLYCNHEVPSRSVGHSPTSHPALLTFTVRLRSYLSRSVWCPLPNLHRRRPNTKMSESNQQHTSEKTISSLVLSPPSLSLRRCTSICVLPAALCTSELPNDSPTPTGVQYYKTYALQLLVGKK